MPLRVLFGRLVNRGELALNPTTGLALPAVRGKRDRVVAPEEAARLLGTLPELLRGIYATAFYAGLRRGEIMGLRWEDVDLEAGLIRSSATTTLGRGHSSSRSRGQADARCRSRRCCAPT